MPTPDQKWQKFDPPNLQAEQEPLPSEIAYIQIIFELSKHFPGLVDTYFGPPTIRESVLSQQPRPLGQIQEQISATLESLPSKPPLEDLTRDYLYDQLSALKVFTKQQTNLMSRGEGLHPFAEYASKILQMKIDLIPLDAIKSQQEAVAQLLNDRYHSDFKTSLTKFQTEDQVGGEDVQSQEELLKIFKENRPTYRQIASKIFPLPKIDNISIENYTGDTIAYVQYHGNFEAKVSVNPTKVRSRRSLLRLVQHELDPGHVTNYELRELFHPHRPLTNCFVYNTPEAVPMEGIGEFASDLATSYLPPELQDPKQDALLDAINTWKESVVANATLLWFAQHQNRNSVANYLRKYGPHTDEDIKTFFEFREAQFFDVYSFAYLHGHQLVAESYQIAAAQKRSGEFLKFLYTNQLTPNMIRNWISSTNLQ